MSLFERFQVVSKRKHDAEVAELVSERDMYQRLAESNAKEVGELATELAPFREHVEQLEAEYPEPAEAEQGAAEAGQEG